MNIKKALAFRILIAGEEVSGGFCGIGAKPEGKLPNDTEIALQLPEAAIARGVSASILIYHLDTRQWCMVYDAFGKTIYATDTIREIGEVYDLEEMNVVYHDVPIPCSILILGESTHEEAEAVYGQPLSKRRHYYEVMAD